MHTHTLIFLYWASALTYTTYRWVFYTQDRLLTLYLWVPVLNNHTQRHLISFKYEDNGTRFQTVSPGRCSQCCAWLFTLEHRNVGSLLSGGEKSTGVCTVKQKAALNSLLQAERDAANPLCECFRLLLWGMLWNWSLHCVTVCEGDRKTMSHHIPFPYFPCILVWALCASESAICVHIFANSTAEPIGVIQTAV